LKRDWRFISFTAGVLFRAGLYQQDDISYADNAARFVFFSKCVAYLARYLPVAADIVHVNDWQTGFVPALMLHQHSRGRVGESAAGLPFNP